MAIIFLWLLCFASALASQQTNQQQPTYSLHSRKIGSGTKDAKNFHAIIYSYPPLSSENLFPVHAPKGSEARQGYQYEYLLVSNDTLRQNHSHSKDISATDIMTPLALKKANMTKILPFTSWVQVHDLIIKQIPQMNKSAFQALIFREIHDNRIEIQFYTSPNLQDMDALLDKQTELFKLRMLSNPVGSYWNKYILDESNQVQNCHKTQLTVDVFKMNLFLTGSAQNKIVFQRSDIPGTSVTRVVIRHDSAEVFDLMPLFDLLISGEVNKFVPHDLCFFVIYPGMENFLQIEIAFDGEFEVTLFNNFLRHLEFLKAGYIMNHHTYPQALLSDFKSRPYFAIDKTVQVDGGEVIKFEESAVSIEKADLAKYLNALNWNNMINLKFRRYFKDAPSEYVYLINCPHHFMAEVFQIAIEKLLFDDVLGLAELIESVELIKTTSNASVKISFGLMSFLKTEREPLFSKLEKFVFSEESIVIKMRLSMFEPEYKWSLSASYADDDGAQIPLKERKIYLWSHFKPVLSAGAGHQDLASLFSMSVDFWNCVENGALHSLDSILRSKEKFALRLIPRLSEQFLISPVAGNLVESKSIPVDQFIDFLKTLRRDNIIVVSASETLGELLIRVIKCTKIRKINVAQTLSSKNQWAIFDKSFASDALNVMTILLPWMRHVNYRYEETLSSHPLDLVTEIRMEKSSFGDILSLTRYLISEKSEIKQVDFALSDDLLTFKVYCINLESISNLKNFIKSSLKPILMSISNNMFALMEPAPLLFSADEENYEPFTNAQAFLEMKSKCSQLKKFVVKRDVSALLANSSRVVYTKSVLRSKYNAAILSLLTAAEDIEHTEFALTFVKLTVEIFKKHCIIRLFLSPRFYGELPGDIEKSAEDIVNTGRSLHLFALSQKAMSKKDSDSKEDLEGVVASNAPNTALSIIQDYPEVVNEKTYKGVLIKDLMVQMAMETSSYIGAAGLFHGSEIFRKILYWEDLENSLQKTLELLKDGSLKNCFVVYQNESLPLTKYKGYTKAFKGPLNEVFERFESLVFVILQRDLKAFVKHVAFKIESNGDMTISIMIFHPPSIKAEKCQAFLYTIYLTFPIYLSIHSDDIKSVLDYIFRPLKPTFLN